VLHVVCMNSVVEPVGTIELVENQVEISAVPQFVTDRLTVLGYGISLILLNVGMYFVAPAIVIYRLKNLINNSNEI